MKRICFCFIVLLISLLPGCSNAPEVTEISAETMADAEFAEYIKELNDNSNLGMELNQDSGLTEEEAKQYGNDYPYVISPDDKDTRYYCFKYPYSDAVLSVTQIEILDEEFHVYGVHLGDSLNDSTKRLKDYGYSENTYPLNNMYQYTKGDINIILSFEEDIIKRIVVSLRIEAEENIMY